MPRVQQRNKTKKGASSRGGARKHARESTSSGRQTRSAAAARASGARRGDGSTGRRRREERRELTDDEEMKVDEGGIKFEKNSDVEGGDAEFGGEGGDSDGEFELPSLPAPAKVPKMPSELLSELKGWLLNLREQHWSSSDRITKQVRQVDEEKYLNMTALVRDPLGQEDDTARLERETRDYVQFLEGQKKNTHLALLWRILPRFMGCLPPALFDGRNLKYDSSDNPRVTIGGVRRPSPIWSRWFCEKLAVLITHPFFQSSPALLAVVPQYAIKLRTNDRRRWPLENPTDGRFLDDLAAAFRHPHPTRSSAEVHTDFADIKAVIQALDGLHTQRC
ncbi:hypothetical protein C8A03DRAFT_37239, partial [Achaetomium macrosporum]